MKKALAVVGVIAVVSISAAAYSFFKTPETADGPIQAVPITAKVVESTPATVRAVATQAADAAVETNTVAEPEVQADSDVATNTATEPTAQAKPDTATNADAQATIPAATPTEVSGADNQSDQDEAGSSITFEIVPAESQARFFIDEILQGEPKTVVGITDQVAGQFTVSPNDLSITQIGIIQVNARTLATDNELRNRAIKNRILFTDDYEFVTFTPREVVGLPVVGAVGETYALQIGGDLTITDVTRPVTFDAVATATSDTRIEGNATTTFPYTDFELRIPDVPGVDIVDDEVRLEFEFVADAVE
jgi:polyisoprenoid-binding protein YceI